MSDRIHFTDAIREATGRNEVIVNVGDMVVSRRWRHFAMVTECGGRPADARLVSLVPPRGYGCWGGYQLDASILRYMGWIEELTSEELSDDGGIPNAVIENGPEDGMHAYALDASKWKKFDAPYWEWFRNAA